MKNLFDYYTVFAKYRDDELMDTEIARFNQWLVTTVCSDRNNIEEFAVNYRLLR